MMLAAAARATALAHFTFFLDALFQMHFGMTLLFIGTGKFSAANVTGERLLAGMGANVRGQMIGT